MVLGIWKGVGWNMVIFLAGLQSIPPDLYEAASVDGAGAWARFRYITLPLLRPVVHFVSVMLVIGAFGAFIPMFILTQGGPEHSTETLLTYGYNNAFSSFDFGYGAAVTYLFAAFVVRVQRPAAVAAAAQSGVLAWSEARMVDPSRSGAACAARRAGASRRSRAGLRSICC